MDKHITSIAGCAMLALASSIASAQGYGRGDAGRAGAHIDRGAPAPHAGYGGRHDLSRGGGRDGWRGANHSYAWRGAPYRYGYYPYRFYSPPVVRYYGAPYPYIAAPYYYDPDPVYEPPVYITPEYSYAVPPPAPLPPPPRAYPVVPPVAQAAPPPAPAPQPASPPRLERYTLSARELFEFDRDELRMPQPKLDEIAAALNGNPQIASVNITGHTDRLGTDAYNLALSKRRAEAVKEYLVSKGVAPTRLNAIGKGKANPVVLCHQTNRAALIQCLEPNRRVEVEQITVERKRADRDA